MMKMIEMMSSRYNEVIMIVRSGVHSFPCSWQLSFCHICKCSVFILITVISKFTLDSSFEIDKM